MIIVKNTDDFLKRFSNYGLAITSIASGGLFLSGVTLKPFFWDQKTYIRNHKTLREAIQRIKKEYNVIDSVKIESFPSANKYWLLKI